MFVGCEKNETDPNSSKKSLLIATQNFHDFGKTETIFKIYSDSSYTVSKNIEEVNYKKFETYEGRAEIRNDTIKFPLLLKYNRCETAILKNGFIEFIDGEYPDRMKIEKTTLFVKKNIDFNKFPNYAIFTFYKNFNKEEWQKDYANYNLNNQELFNIDKIFKSEFRSNKKLRNYNEYLKQIVAIRNSKNEILIQAHFFCKDSHSLESFEYHELSMMDGGNCNVYMEFNLTTGKFNFINIAGIA